MGEQCVIPGNLGTSYLTFRGTKYYLYQYHFHSPSEHTLNGVRYDMDIHFVHKSVAGDLLVLGAFATASWNPNTYLDVFWPTNFLVDAEYTQGFSPYWLLPSDLSINHYNGSLTTPPCTQVVQWLHLTSPIGMSFAQLQAFKAALSKLNQTSVGYNNRNVQLLNGRTVYKIAATDVNVNWIRNSPSPSPSPSYNGKRVSPSVAAFTPIGIIALIIIIAWERYCDRRGSSADEDRWKAGTTVTPGATTLELVTPTVKGTPV